MPRIDCGLATLLRAVKIMLVLFLFSLLNPWSIQAHGGGTPRLINAGEGPYRIFVWTQPEPLRAGEIHVSIAITKPPPEGSKVDDRNFSNDLDSAVKDAEVVLTLARLNDSTAPLVIVAAPSTVSEFFYEADLTLPTDGLWEMSLLAQAELGSSEAEFQAEVLPERQVNWLLLGGGIGLFALLFVGLGVLARRGNLQK